MGQEELIGIEAFILPHVRDDEVADVALVQFAAASDIPLTIERRP